jgi:hypothetical protein
MVDPSSYATAYHGDDQEDIRNGPKRARNSAQNKVRRSLKRKKAWAQLRYSISLPIGTSTLSWQGGLF